MHISGAGHLLNATSLTRLFAAGTIKQAHIGGAVHFEQMPLRLHDILQL